MSEYDEPTVFAYTLYAEARGEPRRGWEWVAWVIKNRAARGGWWGNTIKEVCLKPQQFECWNDGHRHWLPIREQEVYNEIRAMTDRVYRQPMDADPTRGADHYHVTSIHPAWADRLELIEQVGNHIFYRERR